MQFFMMSIYARKNQIEYNTNPLIMGSITRTVCIEFRCFNRGYYFKSPFAHIIS